MDLRDYLRVLRRRWLLVTACTVSVMAVAALITLRTTSQYSSSSRVFVSTATSNSTSAPDTAYTGGMAATQRVQSYAALVSNGELTTRVVKALDLNITPGALAKEIKADVVPETVLLQVSVTDPSAREAQVICRAVVQQLLTLIAEIETPPGKSTPLLKGTVTAPADLPTAPVTPDVLRNLLIGLVLGLLFGIGAAVARELLDTTVKSRRQIEEALDAPVLGGIALDAGAGSAPLITSLPTHAPRAEGFRVLRTNLQFVDVDRERKVIVITSSVPSEGKSSTAVNVAITMAQAGQRVLLVDGDLRRPAVADMLGLENAVGVTTVLMGRVEIEDALQKHAPSGLAVLASGAIPPNPSELLQSHAMGELLARLRDEYDIVIVDSPPLLPVTDAALLARQADGAVVVVRHGRTTKDELHAASDRLTSAGAQVLGGVFNRLKLSRVGNYGSTTGYEYGYGYGPVATDTTDETGGVETVGGLDGVGAVGSPAETDAQPRADRPPRADRTRRRSRGSESGPVDQNGNENGVQHDGRSADPGGPGASVLSISKGRGAGSNGSGRPAVAEGAEPGDLDADRGEDSALFDDLIDFGTSTDQDPGRHRS